MLTLEVHRPLTVKAEPQDLQRLLEPTDWLIERQPVGDDVLRLAATDPQYRRLLRHVRKRQHRLRQQDRMPPDRLSDRDTQPQPSRVSSQIAEDRLVVEQFVRRIAVACQP